MNKIRQEIQKYFIKVPTKPFVEIPLTIYWESSGPKYIYILQDQNWLCYNRSSYEAFATLPLLPFSCLKDKESHFLEKLSQEFITKINKPHWKYEDGKPSLTELICCSTDPTELDRDKSMFFVGMIAY